ncbi:MAG: FAD-binding oxidoreductase [Acidobacteria bacterium]|nr:FAD-binding oxidoreductase [Acidobacteriota bacterium]
MPPGRTSESPRTLIVGAGLTGALLAWICSREGDPPFVCSIDRPASQGTALSAGVVRGLGPPGGPTSWARATPEHLAAFARRARTGYDLLREALLATRRPVGLLRCRHAVRMPPSADPALARRLEIALTAAGYEVHRETGEFGDELVREDDAVLSARRLTFELLRLAAARGTQLELNCAFRGIRQETGAEVVVNLDGRDRGFSRMLWASGRPMRDEAPPTPAHARIVLHQLFEGGREPLREILELGGGEVTLAPAPLRPGQVVLVRTAQESSGGLTWPEPPPGWEHYHGRAVRQRLAEALDSPPERSFVRAGRIVSVSGLSRWPIAAALGACRDAIAALSEAIANP